jgi:hypothetical protein
MNAILLIMPIAIAITTSVVDDIDGMSGALQKQSTPGDVPNSNYRQAGSGDAQDKFLARLRRMKNKGMPGATELGSC